MRTEDDADNVKRLHLSYGLPNLLFCCAVLLFDLFKRRRKTTKRTRKKRKQHMAIMLRRLLRKRCNCVGCCVSLRIALPPRLPWLIVCTLKLLSAVSFNVDILFILKAVKNTMKK